MDKLRKHISLFVFHRLIKTLFLLIILTFFFLNRIDITGCFNNHLQWLSRSLLMLLNSIYVNITYWLIDGWIVWVFNATFSNISRRPAIVVEEPGVPTDHGQATGKLYHFRLRVECTLFCNSQSLARPHAVLVIGLYNLLGNPTT